MRVRLARPDDHVFVGEMAELAEAHKKSSLSESPSFQKGVRAGLSYPGGYWRAVGDAYNRAVDSSGGESAIAVAMAASAFSLVVSRGKERLGALSVGSSATVLQHLLENVDSRQVISLVVGLPKLKSLAVIPQAQGDGIGSQMLTFLGQLLQQLGSVGLYGSVKDDGPLIRFYRTHGWQVLQPGQPLNTWPIAGGHIAKHRTLPSDGPLIQAEPGMRMMFLTPGSETETEAELHRLNPTGAVS